MQEMLRELRDYTDRLARDHDIGAVTLQVCDRTSERHRVIQLLDLKVPSEASHAYQARKVYLEDPFTDVDLNEAPDIAFSDTPISAADARIQEQRAHCAAYWSFLSHYELSVEGFSTRRLRRGVFTIVGFLRNARTSYARPLPLDVLGAESSVLHNMMAAEVLEGALRSNAGLMGLQHMLDGHGAPAADPALALSARGRQVAGVGGHRPSDQGGGPPPPAFRTHSGKSLAPHLRQARHPQPHGPRPHAGLIYCIARVAQAIRFSARDRPSP